MVLTTSRPSTRPSTTLPHSHAHTQRSKLLTTPTPSAHPSRAVASVGYSMPPNAKKSTPAIQENARTPSPNYFGLTVDPANDPRDSSIGPKDNWSPPTSSIRSFTGQSPKHLPLDANPEFEAFKRQTEANNTFSLNYGHLAHFSSTPTTSSLRGSLNRNTSRTDDVESNTRSPRTMEGNQPESSLQTLQFFNFPRQESPANIGSTGKSPPLRRSLISYVDDRHPRLSLPSNRAEPPSPPIRHHEQPHRGETLPAVLKDGPVMISSARLKDILENEEGVRFLLLDLRVAPQYSQFRINGALNLCIPTTLLKRPSFNLVKLTDTFKIEEERARFSTWKECEYIVVYDARSTEKKDATSAVNSLKKFANEGWQGQPCILRGGIEEFVRTYPKLIDYRSSDEIHFSKRSPSMDSSMPTVAPVAGGCEIPGSKAAANPFFSNIRQNMDLVGGVGQIDLKRPSEVDPQADAFLPAWLRKAAAVEDHGKTVASKFLHIEQDELSRMQKALSMRVSYGTPGTETEKSVQIAGFEKGGKNRYNNIWPFEHARVRLQGRPEGVCDYVNASHIKASWSNKRYIASQGPLPATFEDFWSVVWDQDVRVIVMLTAESEGGQLKCHPYWAAKEYGPFKLKALSEKRVSLDPEKRRRSSTRQDLARRRANTNLEPPVRPLTDPTGTIEPYIIVRKFTLSHASEPFVPMREITQLHYSSWPDFGAPAEPKHLLGLIELSNSMRRAALSPTTSSHSKADDPENFPDARPLLVHCSAGCGRTGTFCTVDSVIDMLKRQRKEHRSGVTPMEISASSDIDYVAGGKKPDSETDDWVFDEEVDLVQKTVEDFRMQRISMVQTLRQYVLCYETILEWVGAQRADKKRAVGGSESMPTNYSSS